MFGRQPHPVTIRIEGTHEEDIREWARLFHRGAEHKGDSTSSIKGVPNKFCEFTIYPRAIND